MRWKYSKTSNKTKPVTEPMRAKSGGKSRPQHNMKRFARIALAWALALWPAKADAADTAEWVQFTLTHYCSCRKCCGQNAKGITASGAKLKPGMLAADKAWPFGTKMFIDGKWHWVTDRGGKIKGARLDMAVATHKQAVQLGKRTVMAYVLKPDTITGNIHE